jgi:hypothetical protein
MSNVKLTSNVFLRTIDKPLSEDADFLRQIRGISAVRSMLWYAYEIYPDTPPDNPLIKRLLAIGKITQAQVDTLKWGIRCYRCDSIPVGLTFGGSGEFRCKNVDCR